MEVKHHSLGILIGDQIGQINSTRASVDHMVLLYVKCLCVCVCVYLILTVKMMFILSGMFIYLRQKCIKKKSFKYLLAPTAIVGFTLDIGKLFIIICL